MSVVTFDTSFFKIMELKRKGDSNNHLSDSVFTEYKIIAPFLEQIKEKIRLKIISKMLTLFPINQLNLPV